MPSASGTDKRLARAVAEAVAGDERKLHALMCSRRHDDLHDAYAITTAVRDALEDKGFATLAGSLNTALFKLRNIVIKSERVH
jgi:hypothetical protein